MGGETTADGPPEDEEEVNPLVWVPVRRAADAADSDRDTDEQTGDEGDDADSPDESETETIDLEALITEDPPGERAPTDEEADPQDTPDQSPQDDGDHVAEPRDGHAPGRSTDGGAEPPDEEKSDRLWNRADPADRSQPQSDTAGDSPSDQPATDRSGQADIDETEGTSGASADDPADDDRLWNSEEPEPTGTDEATGGSTPQDRPDDVTDATGGGETAPAGGNEDSGQGTRFDHLLARSGSGSGNARPVGSPSVETDLDAFFSDLDEFDRATSGSQVLVISPRGHSISDEVCSQFLTAGGVSGRNAMFVTAVEPPAERIEICRNSDDWTGGKVAVIELGNTGSDSEDGLEVGGEDAILKRVNSPKNLSKTGLLITQTLKKWTNSDHPSILCFHTLSAISGYVENETLFQFLFTLQAKLNSFGVTGHYHMDANRHDQQEINTLKTLFDLVVTISGNGEIEIE